MRPATWKASCICPLLSTLLRSSAACSKRVRRESLLAEKNRKWARMYLHNVK